MFNTSKLHHAYIIEGDIEASIKAAKIILEKDFNFKLTGNPDVYERIYESFGIDDAREINNILLDKPLGTYKIFLLGIPSMTGQAGNALLKSLEEPPLDTHLFIFTPSAKRMLPTLLSRVMLITKEQNKIEGEQKIEISGAEFLKFNQTKRLEETKKIIGDYEKERISKSDIIVFMGEIIEEYRKDKKRDSESLKRALTAYDYAPDQSSSLKMLLEYIALIL